jgi:hypothetical protein
MISILETSNDLKRGAFREVDERQRMAIRQAFDQHHAIAVVQLQRLPIRKRSAMAFNKRQTVLAIANEFGLSEREVWSAVKNDRSIGGVLDERYWRHGLTISLGSGLSVSEDQVKRRLKYLVQRLKRRIWGNNHRTQRKVQFVVFKHWLSNRNKKNWQLEKGSRHWQDDRQKTLVDRRCESLRACKGRHDGVSEHWHALMAVEGQHGWSDKMIADAINEIEGNRKLEHDWEKAIHVDWNWRDKNQFHSYIGRESKYDGDSSFMMRI